MKRMVVVVMALLLVVGVSAGWAEEIEGKIQQVNMAERVFTLDDGTQIWVAEGLSMDDLKEGASVKASYEERDGKKVATSVEVSN